MLKKEIKRFGDAFRGLFELFSTEPHARFHLLAMLLVIVFGFYFQIASTEWIAILLSIGMVICAEGLNTSIEKLGDFIHKEKHDDMRRIKDIAAGAVLFSALIAITVACIIFIPKIF